MAKNGSMRVLVVEDDIDFREICAQWFTRQGHRAAQAGSGPDALKHLAEQHCDVAIIDMNLPGLTGLELLRRIRETDLETEVIILTGEATVETAVQAMKLGACDYLTKPFPLPELEQRCRMAFDRGRIRKENRQLRALLDRDSPRGDRALSRAFCSGVPGCVQSRLPSDHRKS